MELYKAAQASFITNSGLVGWAEMQRGDHLGLEAKYISIRTTNTGLIDKNSLDLSAFNRRVSRGKLSTDTAKTKRAVGQSSCHH